MVVAYRIKERLKSCCYAVRCNTGHQIWVVKRDGNCWRLGIRRIGNPSKSSGHGKHLHDAHRQDEKYSSGHSHLVGDGTRTKETTSDTLVHRYLPVGMKREPVGGLYRHSSTISDTLVHRYTPVGVKREPVGGLHRQSSTEDNATSFSNKFKPSVDPAAKRTKTVAVASNPEPTKSQHRSYPNVE